MKPYFLKEKNEKKKKNMCVNVYINPNSLVSGNISLITRSLRFHYSSTGIMHKPGT